MCAVVEHVVPNDERNYVELCFPAGSMWRVQTALWSLTQEIAFPTLGGANDASIRTQSLNIQEADALLQLVVKKGLHPYLMDWGTLRMEVESGKRRVAA